MDIYFDYNCVIHFVNLPKKVITQTKKRALKIGFGINATSIININLVFNNNNSIIGIIHNNWY